MTRRFGLFELVFVLPYIGIAGAQNYPLMNISLLA